MPAPVELADIAADVLARVRDRRPRVHCITNTVAQQYTANMLLAAGAVPSMTISPEEIASFLNGAAALLVNLGTFDAERRAAIDAALGAIGAQGMPWVLDPVFVERSPARAQFASELAARGPDVVRLNQGGVRRALRRRTGARRAATLCAEPRNHCGAHRHADLVTDGERTSAIHNGHALMGFVTAMGCAGSALVCAALAVETDAWLATNAALIALGVAGEVAARTARGPGSFAGAIIDVLHHLDRATLRAHTKVS